MKVLVTGSAGFIGSALMIRMVSSTYREETIYGLAKRNPTIGCHVRIHKLITGGQVGTVVSIKAAPHLPVEFAGNASR